MAEDKTKQPVAEEQLLPSATVKATGVDESPMIAAAPGAVRRSLPLGLAIMLGLILTGVTAWFFYHLMWFILMLYLSFIVATILEAPVQWLKRLGIRRGLAAVIIMVGGLAAVSAGTWLIASGVYIQIAAVKDNLAKAPDQINKVVNDFRRRVRGEAKKTQEQPKLVKPFLPSPSSAPAMTTVEPAAPPAGLPNAASQAAGASLDTQPASSQPAASAPASAPAASADFDIRTMLPGAQSIADHLMSGVEAITLLVIMFFIVLYMLVDGEGHLKTIRCLLPKHPRLEATKLFNEVSRAHRGWALASMTNIASSTLLTGTGLWLLGVPGAYILGFIAGLGELIPNIGPLIGAMPALLLTLAAGPEKFFYVVGMFLIVQTIQGYTISPMVMKFGVELPILVTIISVLVMGELFGFLGVLVAVPLVADLVVCWGYLSARREKDTTDYDSVNAPPSDRRQPMSPDNTPAAKLRKMFRRSKQAEAAK